MNGPFSSYTPPSVTTTTVADRTTVIPPSGVQVPIIIGTGRESRSVNDQEIVRGSSAVVDQPIRNETVTDRFVVDATNPNNLILGTNTGLLNSFKVLNFPIVTGTGQGVTSNRTQDVSVTVDGVPVVVAAVDGVRGVITLQVPPPENSVVLANYYYNRTDTFRTDDVSDQVSKEAAIIRATVAGPYAIVSGENDILRLNIDSVVKEVVLASGASRTAVMIRDEINLALNAPVVSIEKNNLGQDLLVFTAQGSLEILDGTVNSTLGMNPGQRTNRNRTFVVFEGPIVDGTNGGVTTNDIQDVQVMVDNVRVIPTHVDGSERQVTLAQPPTVGAEVKITYYHNTYQDTFDQLPNRDVSRVIRMGNAPGRNDYIEGLDYVIEDDKIIWGAAVSVSEGNFTNTGLNEVFNGDKVEASLEDMTVYMERVERAQDRSVSPPRPSATEVILNQVPTQGDGRGQETTNPNHVRIFHGTNIALASLNEAKVVKVDPVTRRVQVRDEIPVGHEIYATYEYNTLVDDTYILTKTSTGKVRVTSSAQGRDLANVRSTNSEIRDAVIMGRNGVNETVTVTFSPNADREALEAIFINRNAGPYDLYAASSANVEMAINGVANAFTFSLAQPGQAAVISEKINDTGLNIGPTDELILAIDGNAPEILVGLDANGTDLADIVGTINTLLVGDATASVEGSGSSSRLVIRTDNVGANCKIEILNGSATSILGLKPFSTVQGTDGAVNQPAEMVSGELLPAAILTLDGKEFKFSIDGGNEKSVVFDWTGIPTPDITDVVTAIGPEAVAVGAVRFKLVGTLDTPSANITIGDGNANPILKFITGATTTRRQPRAEDVVSVLNTELETQAEKAFADVIEADTGGNLVRIRTFDLGNNESITFLGGSALGFDTNLGIKPNDSAHGTDGVRGFTLTSTNPQGSSGEGLVGQTYTDARTGLRFTVKEEVPFNAPFDLIVEFEQEVGTQIPNQSIPGIRMAIQSLHAVGDNDSAIVRTYAKSGESPDIGDFYYISYEYEKVDYSPRMFTNFEDVVAAHGELSPSNPLTLACHLAFLNGASIVATKQVRKAPNSQQAPVSAYLEALKEIEKPLPGGTMPNLIIPLTTDVNVMAATVKHCETQSAPRYGNECRAIFGVASGTRPNDVVQIAKNLNSERSMVLYPDSALASVTNVLGETTSYLVDSTFLGAAIAGVIVSPLNDVATPLTKKKLVGFERLNRNLDAVEMNHLATNGVTVLVNKHPYIEIRHALTTNLTNRLTSTPSIIAIKDYVQQRTRVSLERFIGLKHLTSRAQDVEMAMTSLLNSMVEAKIIVAFQGVSATPDPNDPTILRVKAYYSPVFPLLYIDVTFTIASSF